MRLSSAHQHRTAKAPISPLQPPFPPLSPACTCLPSRDGKVCDDKVLGLHISRLLLSRTKKGGFWGLPWGGWTLPNGLLQLLSLSSAWKHRGPPCPAHLGRISWQLAARDHCLLALGFHPPTLQTGRAVFALAGCCVCISKCSGHS